MVDSKFSLRDRVLRQAQLVHAAHEVLAEGLRVYAEDADPGDLSRQAHKALEILEGELARE